MLSRAGSFEWASGTSCWGRGGTPFYIGGQQYEVWKHTQLLIDLVPGCGSGFSLEAPLGVRFLTRSRCSTCENSLARGV